MRLAMRISKGITLSCCYPIQLSRNRRPRKGGNPARPSRPCQAGCFQVRSEPNPSDADTPTARSCYWERTTEVLRLLLAGTGECTFRPSLCQLPQVLAHNSVTNPAIPLCEDRFRFRLPMPALPFPPLHKLLCRFELSSVFQRSRTAQGPARTTLG